MAIEICSQEKSTMVGVSPRISFSYDLIQSDHNEAVLPIEQQHPLRSNSSGLNSSIDFDFCVRESFEQQSSSADELFLDGKILPIQIKKNNTAPKQARSLPQPTFSIDGNKSLKKEACCNKDRKLSSNIEADDHQKQQSGSKSFWRFKRSSSCGSGYGRSLCPNLPLLSRSNSTGSADSAPSVKRTSILSKEASNSSKQNSQKNVTTKLSQSSNNFYQKPPLKKLGHGSYGNSTTFQINPILNVPTPNLFGLGSIFSANGKDKSKKKF